MPMLDPHKMVGPVFVIQDMLEMVKFVAVILIQMVIQMSVLTVLSRLAR